MSAPHGIEGVYVHIPFCDGKCAYCAFYSLCGRTAAIEPYLAALDAELVSRGLEWPGITPRTLYIGGGTPTLLAPAQLRRLCAMLARRLDLSRLQEWTVEANPGTLEREKLAALREGGVTRISLGVQSFDDGVLARLGRRHTAAQAREACKLVRAAGFSRWSLDLIACVPGFSARGWGQTLREAVSWGCPHLSVYALTSEEGSRLGEAVMAGRAALLDDDAQLRCLGLAERILREAGLRRYEISNYAVPGAECLHHVSCWEGEGYLGLGCAASSHVAHRRWTNAPDLDGYLAAAEAGRLPPHVTDALDATTEAIERLVFGLRMMRGVLPEEIVAQQGLVGSPVARHWAGVLPRLAREGLLCRTGGRWRLTRRGREVADYVAVELLP